MNSTLTRTFRPNTFQLILLAIFLSVAPAAALTLSAPSSLTATLGSSVQINLTWTDNSNNETGFKIERAISSAGPWSQIATVGAGVTSYSNTGLSPATTYYYRVQAYKQQGGKVISSPYSNVASATTPFADTTAPTGSVTINGGATYTNSTAVTLTLSAKDVVGVTGYYLSTNSTPPAPTALGWVAVVSTPSYSGSVGYTLGSGDGTKTVYAWYKDAAGNVSATAWDSIVLDQTAPSVPTGLTATAASCSQINLSWMASTDTGGSGVKGYNVYRNGLFLQQVLAPSTSTSDTGLAASTTYSYTVSAVDNVDNQSAQSTAASRATPACSSDTTAPTGSVVINGNATYTNSIAVTLTLSATDATGVTGYYLSTSSTPPLATAAGWVAVTSTPSYSGSVGYTLSSGDGTKTVYAWYKDAAGNVSLMASDSIVLDQTAPTNGTLTATAGNAQVALSWAGFSDATSGLATYKLVYSTGGFPASCGAGTLLFSGSGTSLTHTGLTNGTTYYYRVCATDNAGNMSSGATASAMPGAADTTAPTGSVVINGNAAYTNATAVTLTLSATDATGVTGYYLSTTSTPPLATAAGWVAVTSTPSYSGSVGYTLGSGDGTKIVYAWYKDAAGNVSLTASDSIVLDQTAPTNGTLTATVGNAQVALSWTGFSDATSGLASYKLVYSTGGFPATSCTSGTLLFSASTTNFTHTGLTNGTTYYYRVCASDNAGNTSTGATASAVPQAAETTPPSVPTGVRAWDASCTQIGVMWTASTDTGGSGLKGYNVYRDGVFLMQVTTTSVLDTVPDGSKTYSYAVSAVDNAGNESAKSASVQASLSGLVSFKIQVTYPTGVGPYSVAIGDLNGDGVPDLVVANYSNNSVSVLLGRGDGTFQSQVTYATGISPRSVAIGDLNRDGKLDLVTANTGSNTVSVLLGRGDGTFQPQVPYATGSSPTAIAIGDLNRDLVPDLAVTNFDDGTVSVLLGHGDGTFQLQTTYATGRWPLSVAVGDLDGDGDLDLVTANTGSNDVSVLLGRGDGTFQPQVTYLTGSSPKSVAIGDVNGDSLPDLVVANYGSATVSVLLGQGLGTFQALPAQTVYSGPAFLAIGNLNRDGMPDLAVLSQGGNLVGIYTGTGTGTFLASGATPATGLGPVFVTIGDLNRDGAPDLVVANFSSNTVSVLLNACQ